MPVCRGEKHADRVNSKWLPISPLSGSQLLRDVSTDNIASPNRAPNSMQGSFQSDHLTEGHFNASMTWKCNIGRVVDDCIYFLGTEQLVASVFDGLPIDRQLLCEPLYVVLRPRFSIFHGTLTCLQCGLFIRAVQ